MSGFNPNKVDDSERNLGDAAEWFACLTPSGNPPSRPTVSRWRNRGVIIDGKKYRLRTVPAGLSGFRITRKDAEDFINSVVEARKKAVR